MFATGLALLIVGYGLIYVGIHHFTGTKVGFWEVWGLK